MFRRLSKSIMRPMIRVLLATILPQIYSSMEHLKAA